MCSKQPGTCFFSLSSYFFNLKNVCSKQLGLRFNLLSYFCNMKHVSLKQAQPCFLVYSSLISIAQILENLNEKIIFVSLANDKKLSQTAAF